MRSAPSYPSSRTPRPSAHAHLGSGQILKARPPRLRQCAQQRTPRGQRTSEPAALALNHPPTSLGTMAAVAAASAELLIIGWYIFRVLLQVFLECCIYWVGFAFRNPPGTQPIARSEGLVGPRRSSTDNDDNTRSLPHPFAPLPLRVA
uniref:Uncharacterized protein n=1 Tax=Ovis aries TaxID=9940 RepID=A0AC11CW01_SHEEP